MIRIFEWCFDCVWCWVVVEGCWNCWLWLSWMANSMEWLRTDEWRMGSNMMWFGCICFLYHLDSFPWSEGHGLRICNPFWSFWVFPVLRPAFAIQETIWEFFLTQPRWARPFGSLMFKPDLDDSDCFFFFNAMSRRIAAWEIPQREYNAPTMLSYRIPIDGQHLLGAQFSMASLFFFLQHSKGSFAGACCHEHVWMIR